MPETAVYPIVYRKAAQKALAKMPKLLAGRFLAAFERIAWNQDRAVLDIKPLRGRAGFGLRIDAWQAIYRMEAGRLVIEAVEIEPTGYLKVNVQVITKDGEPEYAVLPYADYQRLLELAEEAADARSYDEALSSKKETIPQEVIVRLLRGDNPVMVWREYRGLSQATLAERAGLETPVIAMLEMGLDSGNSEELQEIAWALGVDLDDLI